MGLLATAVAVAAALAPGSSVQGRPLAAVRTGPADAPVRVLVVGTVHGEELAGREIVALLRRRAAPAGVQLWTVRDLNPDGARRRSRGNARGVDLNRNFPHRWSAGVRGRFWPGPRAASEPETRWAMTLVEDVRPHISVWFHQPYGFVVDAPGGDARLLREFARVARLKVRKLPRYRGTAVGWQNARAADTTAFVVELGPGKRPRAELLRHVRAIHAVATLRRDSPAAG